MPELPEVEVLRRQLAGEVVGRSVVDAGSHWSDKFTPALEAVGAELTQAGRRGKYLLLGLDDDRELVVHLGMSGSLTLAAAPAGAGTAEPDPHCRAWWLLDDGRTLALRDVRRFGRVRVVPRGDYSGLGLLASMGPEPFDPDLDPTTFWQRSRASRRAVKSQLLGQRLIAGVGNIYADEALFAAGIRPSARRITRDQAGRLLESLRSVLAAGIANGGTTLRDYANLAGSGDNQNHLVCYGRAGRPCVRCGSELRRSVIEGRGTTWCPVCQR
ncbi:MAG TPA: DNA-formamidopyrimidine glycosylase [Acidimicrobiaceae bacterium]|nr:DNA-formamidopyrimidine glycosylase [Acidimicrobiaceae bacterium]HCB37566.1 DNA-formamidopyrimidine glycosylase [Acidimicrobiaceae bacterium]